MAPHNSALVHRLTSTNTSTTYEELIGSTHFRLGSWYISLAVLSSQRIRRRMHLDPVILLALAALIRACVSFGAECRRWLKILAASKAPQRSAKRAPSRAPDDP